MGSFECQVDWSDLYEKQHKQCGQKYSPAQTIIPLRMESGNETNYS